jgi:hypothetical protein
MLKIHASHAPFMLRIAATVREFTAQSSSSSMHGRCTCGCAGKRAGFARSVVAWVHGMAFQSLLSLLSEGPVRTGMQLGFWHAGPLRWFVALVLHCVLLRSAMIRCVLLFESETLWFEWWHGGGVVVVVCWLFVCSRESWRFGETVHGLPSAFCFCEPGSSCGRDDVSTVDDRRQLFSDVCRLLCRTSKQCESR